MRCDTDVTPALCRLMLAWRRSLSATQVADKGKVAAEELRRVAYG